MQPTLLRVFALASTLFLCFQAWAQNKVIKGTVLDESGAPVQKATVLVKGLKQGTSTADNGTFQLSIPSNAILIISAVGFNKQEVKTTGLDQVNLTLSPNSNDLNEVVVTALGVKREKRNITFSSQEIKSDELLRA